MGRGMGMGRGGGMGRGMGMGGGKIMGSGMGNSTRVDPDRSASTSPLSKEEELQNLKNQANALLEKIETIESSMNALEKK
jgi:hypothetical protein